MGTDKRAVLIDGTPMLRRTVLAVAAVSDEVLVACRRSSPPDPGILEALPVHVVFDRFAEAGPLAGVEAALRGARSELVLIVAGDMPWIKPAVLRIMLESAGRHPEADILALQTDRGLEPLLAVYHKRARHVAAELLAHGERRMHTLLEVVRTRELKMADWQPADPTRETSRNVNMPADLTRSLI